MLCVLLCTLLYIETLVLIRYTSHAEYAQLERHMCYAITLLVLLLSLRRRRYCSAASITVILQISHKHEVTTGVLLIRQTLTTATVPLCIIYM
jgi:hypothetical protein